MSRVLHAGCRDTFRKGADLAELTLSIRELESLHLLHQLRQVVPGGEGMEGGVLGS